MDRHETRSTDYRILVAMATYNEMENLPSLIDAVRHQLPAADVLVVDDNSPDGTGEWLRGRVATDAQVFAMHRPGKLGLGSATLEAMRYAIRGSYDLLVTLDADWSHDPKYLNDLVHAMRVHPEALIAIGSRYVPGGGIDGWPMHRRCMSRMMNMYARFLLRLSARDCTGAFRCYRVSALKQVDWNQQHVQGYAFLEEILWRLNRHSQALVEVPIRFVDRQKGATKLGFSEALQSVVALARFAVTHRDNR